MDTSGQFALGQSPYAQHSVQLGVQSVVGTSSAQQRGLLGESLAVSDFGSNLQIHANTGFQGQRSVNVAKGSFGGVMQAMNGNFVGNGITHTEGNQSMAALSQGDVASHQGKEEMREQIQYKRQLHSNMTQRVLNQKQEQDAKDKVDDAGSKKMQSSNTAQAENRGLQLDHSPAWSSSNPGAQRHHTPSAAAPGHQSNPFGVISSA